MNPEFYLDDFVTQVRKGSGLAATCGPVLKGAFCILGKWMELLRSLLGVRLSPAVLQQHLHLLRRPRRGWSWLDSLSVFSSTLLTLRLCASEAFPGVRSGAACAVVFRRCGGPSCLAGSRRWEEASLAFTRGRVAARRTRRICEDRLSTQAALPVSRATSPSTCRQTTESGWVRGAKETGAGRFGGSRVHRSLMVAAAVRFEETLALLRGCRRRRD